MDYSNFNLFKYKLQKLYNYKAVEEKEIIYACQILKNPIITEEDIDTDMKSKINQLEKKKTDKQLDSRPSNISVIEMKKDVLLLITTNSKYFFIEIITIMSSTKIEVRFNYCSKFQDITNIDCNLEKSEIIFSPKNFSVQFNPEFSDIYGKNRNYSEFLWCMVHIIELIPNNTIKFKNINYKDLEDFAEINNLKENITPKFFAHVSKKDFQNKNDITDEELDTLQNTLSDLGIHSIISYDLEHLNSKIEEFSIAKSEVFLKQLNGDFKNNVDGFLIQLNNLDEKIATLSFNTENDKEGVVDLYGGIQKIEEKNHRIKLRNLNKKKLVDFMKNLMEQLTITPQRKEVLLHTPYIATSELVIVNEVLDNFVKFYKNRKLEKIDMDIIEEGDRFIKNIISDLIKNYDANVYNYIKKNNFTEGNLLRNLHSFKNKKLNQTIAELKSKLPSAQSRISLKNYLLDRKFMVKHLNSLFEGQKNLNEIDAFTLCSECISKGMRDSFAREFNSVVNMWAVFFESNFLNDEKYNLYLDSDTFLNYDPFDHLYSEPIYEANKFFSVLIMNTFFNFEVYIDLLKNYFSYNPLFNIEKYPNALSNCERIISKKVFDSMSVNFQSSMQKSFLLAIIIYGILSCVKEKISESLNDFVQISLKDIFYIRKNEDENSDTVSSYSYNNEDVYSNNQNDKFNLESLGIYKISSVVTKEFVANNIKILKEQLVKFMEDQKQIICDFKCEIRRIGIIPIVKKSINFLKLLLAITNGIKSDSIFILIEGFKVKLKSIIEKLSKTQKKYTNIVLTENFHYISRFFREFEKYGLNVDSPKLNEYENEFDTLYENYKAEYIYEIFEYQFPEFAPYYSKFEEHYQANKNQIKLQHNYIPQVFIKYVQTFLKSLPKNVETMASRVAKHYCKEENLGPHIWSETALFMIKKLKNIKEVCSSVYEEDIDISGYVKLIKGLDFKDYEK